VNANPSPIVVEVASNRLTMMTVSCLTLLLTCSSSLAVPHSNTARPSASLDVLPPISVAVFAARDINESVMNRVLDEAQAIWEPAGITFIWHRRRFTGWLT
jgi:hypothetical protein